jgi:colanic acid biosynthesis glycosyl transferase WcaI
VRILIQGINFAPEPVGVGKYTGEMAQWLAMRGHEVHVVTAPPFNPHSSVWPQYRAGRYAREIVLQTNAANLKAAGGLLEIIRCPVWVPRTPGGLRRILHLLSFAFSSWPRMLGQLPWRPQIVFSIVPTLFCAPQALFIARCLGIPAWLHVQDLELNAAFELNDLHVGIGRRGAFALEELLLRRFDAVSTISRPMLDRLIQKGVERQRCVLFPNWVDVDSIYPLSMPSPFRTQLEIDSKTTVALYSGSMGRKQGIDLVVEVARKLSAKTDVVFVLCGDGSERQRIAEQAHDLANVRFLPVQPVERLNELLNLADIHLLPQRLDVADLVMPSKLTGMFASGRPVITTACPGTELATVVSSCGMVVPPGDADSFCEALMRLKCDRELREQLGHAARNYATENFASTKILTAFENRLVATNDSVFANLKSERGVVDASDRRLCLNGSSIPQAGRDAVQCEVGVRGEHKTNDYHENRNASDGFSC